MTMDATAGNSDRRFRGVRDQKSTEVTYWCQAMGC